MYDRVRLACLNLETGKHQLKFKSNEQKIEIRPVNSQFFLKFESTGLSKTTGLALIMVSGTRNFAG